jgi:protein-L-isoaspartate(D-aspartate) O-methyltransferase
MKPMTEEHLAILRRHMVEVIAIETDLMGDELGKPALDQRVLTVMGRVPRHLFVPLPLAPHAYRNSPLPIGFDKTISQPFIAALMTDLLAPQEHESVLEIGTGLGYQTALLAELSGRFGALRSSRSWQPMPRSACDSSATQISVFASEMGHVAGPSTRLTTRSW